jgi:hypothetical protein
VGCDVHVRHRARGDVDRRAGLRVERGMPHCACVSVVSDPIRPQVGCAPAEAAGCSLR